MKTIKIKAAPLGTQVKFINNGRIKDAPYGATLVGNEGECSVQLNNNLTLNIRYSVGVKNPQTGFIYKLVVNDLEILNDPKMGSFDIIAPYEEGSFVSPKGNTIIGYMVTCIINNIYAPKAKAKCVIVDAELHQHDNCILGDTIEWGI